MKYVNNDNSWNRNFSILRKKKYNENSTAGGLYPLVLKFFSGRGVMIELIEKRIRF